MEIERTICQCCQAMLLPVKANDAMKLYTSDESKMFAEDDILAWICKNCKSKYLDANFKSKYISSFSDESHRNNNLHFYKGIVDAIVLKDDIISRENGDKLQTPSLTNDKCSIFDESPDDTLIITDDSLLLAGTGNNNFDIYKKYVEETGDDFFLHEIHISIPYKTYYGIPKSSWGSFRKYLDSLRSGKGPVRIIWVPTSVDINGKTQLLYMLTFLNFEEETLLFYSDENATWRSIYENNFLDKSYQEGLSEFCTYCKGI